MSKEQGVLNGPRMEDALNELRCLIRAHYPQARFSVAHGHDEPENVHLVTTVDLEDADEVLDLVIDRLVELQVEERIPVHVIPVRPVRRVLETLRERERFEPGLQSLSATIT